VLEKMFGPGNYAYFKIVGDKSLTSKQAAENDAASATGDPGKPYAAPQNPPDIPPPWSC
jgi:hypothetical protein